MINYMPHFIWAIVTLYLAHLYRKDAKAEPLPLLDPLEPRIKDLETQFKEISTQAAELTKLTDDTKKLISQANLSMGIKSLVRRE